MQGEKERQWKKMFENTYDISSIKRVTKKFLDVSRCSRSKQRQRNVQKSLLHLQSCFFLLIRPIAVFHRSPALPSLRFASLPLPSSYIITNAGYWLSSRAILKIILRRPPWWPPCPALPIIENNIRISKKLGLIVYTWCKSSTADDLFLFY